MDIVEIVKSRARGLGEKVFIVPDIPKGKLSGAVDGITGGAAANEKVIAVLDITLFGGCDDGVVFTDRAMYSKRLMEDVQSISYDDVVSAEVKGVVLKEIIVHLQDGGTYTIDAQDFKAEVAASILNTIAEAREEELRRSVESLLESAGSEDSARSKGRPEFEAARSRIKSTGVILLVVGIVLCFMSLLWWGIPAIIIALELFSAYRKDENLYDKGMPADIYEQDVKDTLVQAWVGAALVIGIFTVPWLAAKSRNRMSAILVALDVKATREERIFSQYSQFMREFGHTNDPLGRKFVSGYLDRLVEREEVVRLDVGGGVAVFSACDLSLALNGLRSAARKMVRMKGEDVKSLVKARVGDDDELAEAIVNMPSSGLEPYTFEDGTYYVHGINNDRVRVCAGCGIAELVDDESAEGEYYCSDYCRETEEMCARIVDDLRAEKFARAGIDGASFGGVVGQVVSALSDNRRGVAKRLGEYLDKETGEKVFFQTGHGVAAENANTRIDKLMGRHAEILGNDNSRHGADRLVDGKFIQTKYCANAMKSVDAAFNNADGSYGYYQDGKPMQLEVPRDQYQKAVEFMEEKIQEGKVPGVTDPKEAESLVRKGHLTYKQSQNLCKCCTIESLAYDAYTGAIVGVTAGGISFVLTTALSYYKTRDLKTSLQAAVGAGLETGGKAFCVYVLSAQVQRTAFVKAFMSQSAMDVNWGAHGKFVERIGKGLGKMSGAKSGTITKNANVAVKGAVITAAATFAVTSAWEVGKMCCGKMSGMQCIKNIAVSGGGITAGTAGALFMGALMAPIPGGVFLGGLLGGAIGGFIGGAAAKAGMDGLIEDDSVMVMALLSDEFKILAAGFCLNGEEIGEATKEVDEIASAKGFVEDVYSMKSCRRGYIARLLKPVFIRICMKRPVLFDKDVSAKAIENSVIDV